VAGDKNQECKWKSDISCTLCWCLYIVKLCYDAVRICHMNWWWWVVFHQQLS